MNIDKAFLRWWNNKLDIFKSGFKDVIATLPKFTVVVKVLQLESYRAGVEDGTKQSRVDLAEDIHVALTFAECGLKDKDYALKLSREIIDIELDDEYWNNPK